MYRMTCFPCELCLFDHPIWWGLRTRNIFFYQRFHAKCCSHGILRHAFPELTAVVIPYSPCIAFHTIVLLWEASNCHRWIPITKGLSCLLWCKSGQIAERSICEGLGTPWRWLCLNFMRADQHEHCSWWGWGDNRCFKHLNDKWNIWNGPIVTWENTCTLNNHIY